MAITTGDGLLAGMKPRESFIKATGTMEAAGVFASLFYTAGRPGAAVAPTPGLAGAALTTYAGQMPWTNPTGGALSYLARVFAGAGVAGSLFVCDRLWHNSGLVVTTTTAQTVNSVAWPARDRDGSTNGADVMVALEVSAATTNGAAVTNMTMSYTDDGGNAGAAGAAASGTGAAGACGRVGAGVSVSVSGAAAGSHSRTIGNQLIGINSQQSHIRPAACTACH